MILVETIIAFCAMMFLTPVDVVFAISMVMLIIIFGYYDMKMMIVIFAIMNTININNLDHIYPKKITNNM